MIHTSIYGIDEILEEFNRLQREYKEQKLAEIVTKYDFVVGSIECKTKLMEILPERANIICSPYIARPTTVYVMKKFEILDCIKEERSMTREEAIKNIKEHCYFANLIPQAKEALDMAIKALEQESCCNCIEFKRYAKEMGFEIEREPKSEWQKDHEILKAYSDGANGVLDELRAEIAEEKEHAYADFERYKVECLGQDWEDALDSLPQDDFRYGMERCIDIINKYKTESEG